MVVCAGAWLVAGLGAVLMVVGVEALAPIPEELVQELSKTQQASAPLPHPSTLPAPTSTTPDQPAAVKAPLQSTASTPPPAASPVAAPDEQHLMQVALSWLGRAWPLITLMVAVFMVGTSWLYGGQLGYIVKQVREEASPVSELWRAGTRALGPMLAGSLLSLLASAVVALVIGLIGWVVSLLPQVLGMVLGLLLLASALVAVVSVLVSVTFWFIAIVADRLGPLGGLKTSFRIVRGRWWKTCGLLGCLMLIALALALPLGILNGIGNAVGGVGGVGLVFLSSMLQLLVVNLYLGFVFSAASLRYYEDAKTA